jgi:hypothetical protein
MWPIYGVVWDTDDTQTLRMVVRAVVFAHGPDKCALRPCQESQRRIRDFSEMAVNHHVYVGRCPSWAFSTSLGCTPESHPLTPALARFFTPPEVPYVHTGGLAGANVKF